MLYKNKNRTVFIVVILIAFVSCKTQEETKPKLEETLSFNQVGHFKHFNHLYKEIDFKGKKVGIVHIYSQYPDYAYAIEPKEGFTCVDDVARAVVMLSKYLKRHDNDQEALNKMKHLVEFILQMQHANGYFNNFIWNDFSINATYKTSVAELNWWSFRALWGLESAYNLLKSDADLADRIALTSEKLIANIKRDVPIINLETEFVETIEVPTWLPQKYASDQSALLILGLLKYYDRTADNDIKVMIEGLAQGIIIMQKGDADNYPYGAFLSWGNLWHAWGNNQAYALLKAGQKFNNQTYIAHALLEIDNFYPYLVKNGFAEAFWIKKVGKENYSEIGRNKYPQIAYGLRPMVWAASEAYQYSKNEKYFKLATDLESWLSGKNDAKSAIFNTATGICFDGIVSQTEINKNAGAESTIESLLMLLEMEKLK